MTTPLLTTKIHLPPSPAALVNRARLASRLESALEHRSRVILISAPAGCGKSTLAAEWARQASGRVGWVSLDSHDNDPARFWAYVIAAAQTCHPGFGEDILNRLTAAQPQPVEECLIEMINHLAALQTPLVFVLEDYHAIEQPALHDQVAALVERAPQGMTVVIVTRSDPPLPLHRWRARAWLAEIRAADLRFTNQEAALFLNTRMGLALQPAEIDHLEERIEGWAAGLQLAALSLQGQLDPAGFIQRFSGSHHYVLEYLTHEALMLQAPEVQEFLLQTAILSRFCAELCDAVTGKDQACTLLPQVLRANLFLIPLDDENAWFRYHHLFADLLRLRLAQQYPEQVAGLHQRAARWHDRNGLVDEALSHALAAEDDALAADLVNRNWRLALHQGLLGDSRRWIEALPKKLLAAHPLLSAAYAWNLYLLGQNSAAEPHIQNTLRGLAELRTGGDLPDDDEEYTTLPGQMAALQAMIAARRLDFRTAADQAQQAIEIIPPGGAVALGPAWMALANAQRELGQFAEAIRSYRQAIPLLDASQNPMGWAVAVFFQGRVLQIQGRLREAQDLYQSALATAQAQGRAATALGLLQVGLGDLYYEWNDLQRAEACLAQGLDQDQQSGYVDMIRFGAILKARLARARGRLEEAVRELETACRAVRAAGAPNAEAELRAWQVRFQVEAGDLAALEHWARDLRWTSEWGYTQGILALGFAYAELTAGCWQQALTTARQLEIALADGGAGWRSEARYIQALAAWIGGKHGCAVQTLARSLRLMRATGLARAVVDRGEPAFELLRAGQSSGLLDADLQAYVDRLLAAFPPTVRLADRGAPSAAALTRRELDVLRLMAAGLTNPEIAGRLVVSPGTVKTHVSHIYAKLDTRSRADTVLKAKLLDLI